jgi:hypothetical protein
MTGASPIPQQWWSAEGGGGPSAMDAAANRASASYESGPNPNLSQQMGGMNMGPPQPQGHNYGQYNPNANQGNGGPSTPMGINVPPPPPRPRPGPAANGLIRLTLKKPMGIVFEPMEDPHNPSQQRGVRICDLPRTGAAAMSGMLEVGDELLSINNKPMSRLTFDEIMDFIIDADADNVDLLFRRPKKDKTPEGARNQTTTIKWDTNVAPIATDEDGTVESPKRPGKSGSPGRKNDARDEESLYSGDETFYTEQTEYTEDTMKDKKSGKRGRGRRYESESFLDMLIDTVCAPVMGGDHGRGYDSDDDQTFNSMDDNTYDTMDEDPSYLEQKKKRWQETKKKNIRQLKKESEDEKRRKTRGEKQRPSKNDHAEENDRLEARGGNAPNMQHDPYGGAVQYSQPQNPQIIAMPNAHDMENRMPMQQMPMQHMPTQHMPMQQEPSSPPRSPRRTSKAAASTPERLSPRNSQRHSPSKQQQLPSNMPQRTARASSRFHPQVENGDTMEIDPQLPFKEITYDDQVDEQVSVMESVGGPSLLLENLRNASQLKRTVEEDMIDKFGKDFKPDLGLTREESIQMNPERFYRHSVKKLLQDNEPEKVRLMDKLFDKYRGREEHLLRKLDARYEANKAQDKVSTDKGKSNSTEGSFDGFKAFGGGNFSKSSSGDNAPDDTFGSDAWKADGLEFQTSTDGRPQGAGKPQSSARQNVGFGGNGFDEKQEDDHSSYTESEDYESIDGTSPAVIAQVSELLNYVYGKTTVAGQIDRVSTIMRAYEGRESILLELLETKALLKANNDKSNIEDLPESLRDNPGLEQDSSVAEVRVRPGKKSMMSPISNMTGPSSHVSHAASNYSSQPSVSMAPLSAPSGQMAKNAFAVIQGPSSKKKKKGIFGGMFKKKNKGAGGAFPTGKKGILLGTENGGY